MPKTLASHGSPGRIGDIHLDVIESVSSSRVYDRTATSIESGAPIGAHRQQVPFGVVVTVLISDVSPVVLGVVLQVWERDHAAKTQAAIHALQKSGETVEFFDGARFWTAPGGRVVWIVDAVDEPQSGTEEGTWRATIRLGERPSHQAQFTGVDPGLALELADDFDGVVDKGTQSTQAVPASAGVPV